MKKIIESILNIYALLDIIFSSFWVSIWSGFEMVFGIQNVLKIDVGPLLDRPWAPRGGQGRLGAVLGWSWGGLGASWEVLGWSWGVSGRSWGGLGASWGALGVILGRLGLVLGRLVAQKAAERFKKARSGLFGLLGAVQFCFCIVQALQSVISLLWRTQAARGALKRHFPFSAAQVLGFRGGLGRHLSIKFRSFFEMRFFIYFL